MLKPLGQIVGNAGNITGHLLVENEKGERGLSVDGQQIQHFLTDEAVRSLDAKRFIHWLAVAPEASEPVGADALSSLYAAMEKGQAKSGVENDMFSVTFETLSSKHIAEAERNPVAPWADYINGLAALRQGNNHLAASLFQRCYTQNPLELGVLWHYRYAKLGPEGVQKSFLPPAVDAKHATGMARKYLADFMEFDLDSVQVKLDKSDAYTLATSVLSVMVLVSLVALAFTKG